MKHIHDKKILHRDLKAGNIFLTQDKVIFLIIVMNVSMN